MGSGQGSFITLGGLGGVCRELDTEGQFYTSDFLPTPSHDPPHLLRIQQCTAANPNLLNAQMVFLNACCSVERQQAMPLLSQAQRSSLSAACQARHSEGEGEVSLHCPRDSLVYLLVKNDNSTPSCSSHSIDATHIFTTSLLYFTRLPTKWSLWSPLATPHTVIYVSLH